jgi:hypothetical protein
MTNSPIHPLRPQPAAAPRPGPDPSYTAGVTRLAAGQPDALAALTEAVAHQPDLATTHIALACAYALDGNYEQAEKSRAQAQARLGEATREERQQIEILAAIVTGQVAHALGLAFEHLDEFNATPLIVHMLSAAVAERQDPPLSAGFDAFLERVKGKSGQLIPCLEEK